MSRPRHNPKPDANHNIIPEFIESVGGHFRGYTLDCIDISKTGGRRTDWIMAVGSCNVFIEIKTPEAYRQKDHGLTMGEKEFFDTWPGHKAIIDDYEKIEDMIIQIIGEIEDL